MIRWAYSGIDRLLLWHPEPKLRAGTFIDRIQNVQLVAGVRVHTVGLVQSYWPERSLYSTKGLRDAV